MIGPAHSFALFVSVRLLEQLSGSSSGLPKSPTLLGVLFGDYDDNHDNHDNHVL